MTTEMVDMSFLNAQHGLFRKIWQNDFSAPVSEVLESGAKVLDVGTGTGIWVVEMANNYPNSHFIGIDDLTLFTQQNETLNSKFIQHNLLEILPFEDNYFDYVHCRNALMAFSIDEWEEKIIPEMIRVTKPLGFVEHCEVDERHVNEGPIMKQVTNAIASYNSSRNVDGMIGENLDEILIRTGQLSDNIHHQQKYCPLGSWGGNGKLAIDVFIQRCRSIKPQIIKVMEITPQEFDDILAKVLVESESTRTYLKSHRIYAQKRA